MKKHPDIFSDRALLESANKKREIQDRFRDLASKVFSKPKHAAAAGDANHSTPVHGHLANKYPAQWTHEHPDYHQHFSGMVAPTVDAENIETPPLAKFPSMPPMHYVQAAQEKAKVSLAGESQLNLMSEDSVENTKNSQDLHASSEPFMLHQLGKKRSVLKMNADNLHDVSNLLSRGEVSLGITLLKRLRKYKLITSTVHHDGRVIVGISPRVDGRIIRLA